MIYFISTLLLITITISIELFFFNKFYSKIFKQMIHLKKITNKVKNNMFKDKDDEDIFKDIKKLIFISIMNIFLFLLIISPILIFLIFLYAYNNQIYNILITNPNIQFSILIVSILYILLRNRLIKKNEKQ